MVLRLFFLFALFYQAPVFAVFSSENTSTLENWLIGTYQSKLTQIQGQDVKINLQILPIWSDRVDGEWLYLEGQVAGNDGKPFHQRIVQLVESFNGVIRFYNYTIPRASDFQGAYFNPAILASLTPSQLTLNTRCEFIIVPEGKSEFVGKIGNEGCHKSKTGMVFTSKSFTVSKSNITLFNQINMSHPQANKPTFSPIISFSKKSSYQGLVKVIGDK